VSISPFGTQGPWCEAPANEFTLQGWSGKLATNYGGDPSRAPVAAGGEPGRWLTGAFAALGALAYCRVARERSTAVRVDVSVLEAMAAVFGQGAVEQDLDRATAAAVAARPGGREIPSIHAAADGLVAFAIVTAQTWFDFCVMIDQPQWVDDAELATSAGRRRRSVEVLRVVDAWVGARSVDDITELAALFRIAAGAVSDGRSSPTLACYRDTYFADESGLLRPRSALRLEPIGGDALDASAETAQRDSASLPTDRPLDGVRIADFTAFWAGPYASCLLALLGADVVHVESPKRPDGMRTRSSRPPSDPTWLEWSALFHANNGSKRAISIDMDRPEGLEIAEGLIQRSDGVIENFTPRVMDKFRLDRAGIARLRSDSVYVRMPAFGLDNPWRDRPAFQHTIEPIAGIAGISGYPDRDPQPVMVCDGLAGVHAAFAMLCGLHHRDQCGEGVHVEVRLSEVAAAIAAEQVLTASSFGVVLTRRGNSRSIGGPQGVYECLSRDGSTDRWVAISAGNDDERGRLEELIAASGDGLEARLAEWCATRTVDDVVSKLWSLHIPVAPVVSSRRLPANPQLRHRCFYTSLAHPVCGVVHYPKLPMNVTLSKATELPTDHRSPAPLIAQHDDVIETVLGVSAKRAQELLDAGVCGPPRGTSTRPM
jgi:crotonobetainyl-CoA:carnitine CoA-transferase CaiB-like acyl-CoA transferase